MKVPPRKLAKAQALSKRETQVARLVASGLSNREVAQGLSLSHHTIKNYLLRVFEKLGISTRVELVLYMLSQHKRPESEQKQVTGMALKMRA
jgi:DNA-binding CsgD family transcriptional regulator